jgi:hypothetical protein
VLSLVLVAGELLEYIDAMDYNKYFDAMPSRKVRGAGDGQNRFSSVCRYYTAAECLREMRLDDAHHKNTPNAGPRKGAI